MPVISFANPKGGAGKTTSALLLATELAQKGANVSVIDADPERWISTWAALPGVPDNITVNAQAQEDTVVDIIEDAMASSQFVIIDLEGTANLLVANAIGMSELVIVPTQGASMDARGAAKTIKLIRNQSRMARRQIPHAVLLTRTSAAIATRAQQNVRQQLATADIPVLSNSLVERAAFRELFDYGGVLADLPKQQVSNVEKAVSNARLYTAEVIDLLRSARLGMEAAE